MLHQLHQTYRLLAERPAHAQVRHARSSRWVIRRRRLRDLLRAPGARLPMGVHYA